MARQFLTGINLNKNELLNAAIQNLATAPASPVSGQIYFNTGDNTLRYWDGTAWLTLAQGGDVASAITAAVDAITTDAIEEGTTNLYFTNERAVSAQSGLWDASGAASAAQTAAKGYTDSAISALSSVYDALGAASSAQTAANSYTDGQITTALSTASGYASTAESNAKAYADALAQGLNVKDSVRAATSIPGILSTDFDNGSTVGGVTVATGDRILIKNQSPATENGIYVVNASGAPTRAADADPVADELAKGSYVLVTDGTYAATGWIVTDYSAGATTWTQFSAANEYTAGHGINITNNAIGVNLGTGIAFDGVYNISLDGANGYGVRRYAESNGALTAVSGAVTWTVTHNLNSRDLTVQVFELSGYQQVEVDVIRTDSNTVTLSWVSGDVVANAYRVVVVG